MALKITTRITEVTTVKLEGRLSGPSTKDLVRLCRQFDGPLEINLSGLMFADAEGVDALTDLQTRGAKLVHARPYLSMLLRERTDEE